MEMTMTLEKKQLFSMDKADKVTLKCLSGHLWITTDTSDDITIRAGEKAVIHPANNMVVQSIIHSKLSVCA